MLFESDKKTTQAVAGGYKRVLHLSFAANPNIHRNHNQPRKAALYFCGIHTKEREALLAAAKDVPLTVEGKGWKRAALPAFADAQDGMVFAERLDCRIQTNTAPQLILIKRTMARAR